MVAKTNQTRLSQLWTLPNILCYTRMLGSLVLLGVSFWGQKNAALALVIVLILTDWLDGKLAVVLNQKTEFGAKLDSVADALLYLCLLVAILQLNPAYITGNAIWVAAGLASYLVNLAVCLAKFRKWPSYHTRLAKTSWALTAIAAVGAFFDWGDWPVRIAASVVTVANIEETLMSLWFREYRINVSSLLTAEHQQEERSGSTSD